MIRIGFFIMLIAFILSIIETIYFDWRTATPSNFEYWCDCIIYSISIFGLLIIINGTYIKIKNKLN